MSIAVTASSSAPTLSGLASGMDWNSIINEMVTIEEAPETLMKAQQTTLGNENTSYTTIGTDLAALQKDVTTLMDPSFFASRTASVADSSLASATAAVGTPLGSYTFKITQLASDASWLGAVASANHLSATADVSGVTLAAAGFATPVTAGTFTVNGKQITIASTDTLQSVFTQINTATGVTGSYNPTTDEITLSSSSPIVLGNANDTSNFLQVAQLYNNGGGSITSAMALGGVKLDSVLSSANLATPINDGGAGNGQFLINGVAIDFNASTDTVNSVLQKINDSAAGVTATFDASNNQFQLTNTTTGDVGISLQDVTGNFLTTTGLSAGALQRGTNLQYSINGGGTLTSQSNTVDSSSSGITGLSVTALGLGTTAVSVQSDTSTIATAINSFVTDFNAVQNYISSQTKSTLNADNTVTAGTLTGDMDVEGIATQLRQLTDAAPPGQSAGVQDLNDLGVASNGTDNTLAVDSTALNAALGSHLQAIQQLFTDPTHGLAATLNSYLAKTTGSKGLLATKEAGFTQQSKDIGTSITNLQQKIAQDETRLQNEFVAMETAINTINTQKQYLTDFFNEPTSSSAAPTTANSSSSSSTGG
ncbi:MAG: flagellar filament capping protein FliD [Verrucomicrobiota bacterium]